ncbi:MAG: ABC transporter ATP-binding protein, partial [Actinomycetota bacterium]
MRLVLASYRLLDRRGRLVWLAAIPLTVGIALLEGFAMAFLFPVIQVIADGDVSDAPEDLGWVGDLTGATDPSAILGWAVGIVASLFLLRSALGAAFSWWHLGVMNRAEARLAVRLFERYVRAPVTLHRRVNSAETIRSQESSVNGVVRAVLIPATLVVADLAVLVTIGVVLLLADPFVSVVTGAYLLLASIGFVAALSGRARRLGRGSEALNEAGMRLIHEALDGVKTIQAIGAEDHLTSGYRRVADDQQRVRQATSFLAVLPRYYLEITLVLTGVIVAAVSSATLGGDEALAYVSLLVAASLRSLAPAGRVVTSLNTMRTGDAAVANVYEALDELDRAELARRSDHELAPIEDAGLVLEGVGHVYEDGRRALDGIDLHIAHGQSVGIVGPSGSGKSTLAAILSSLLVPSEGGVWIDGIPLSGAAVERYRSRVAYVPQTAYLTEESLRRNVAFGVEASGIDDDRVVAALHDAGLREVLDQLPDGLDSCFGENGARLSGGQRQRISIARALYRDPEVLVLDEPTSSV